MSGPTSSPLDSTEYQISPPGSFPSDDITRLADQNVPLVGKPASSVRAPRPAGLTWTQLQNVEKDTSGEHAIATRSATSHSGPVSPISPISSSEALQTPNLDRSKNNPYRTCSSPGSSSQVPPRLHSPASQIFERSVQEDIIPTQASPSIPAHIRTENYIPPVLEASSAAITDEQLDPDSVEIVTHSLHQPATGIANSSTAEQSLSSSGMIDHAGLHSDADEMSSSYGALDTDVRRLSFISFADVVNAEHAAEHAESESVYSRDPSQGTGNPITVGSLNRSPSPLRSPASSHGLGTSPPTSIEASFIKGLDMSPSHHAVRRPGSPLPLAQSPVSSSFGGELNVETMSQALRRTGSGDLGGVISHTTSAVGVDETLDRSTGAGG
ncbi:hypothetical protein N7509_005349 [Penicillium cosmopolitanum]|uniref:Uncharacterized protein n=1 Tax=Penicillium cosmopolitanum TaxID=1131564 RepID=A0A9W9W2B0_9EURO|nr:uncharacterized protein N7509_005349 [Penicillium cosmopolitanum]KAJ5397236.1 hypothetical protein N7509_005349 [Penicillium cosmopolitanum]